VRDIKVKLSRCRRLASGFDDFGAGKEVLTAKPEKAHALGILSK
jgi:hypothetical protein